MALLDSEVVPVELGGCDPPLRSDRFSRGHRLEPAPVEIANAAVYAPTLAAVDVQVERHTRAERIREPLEPAATDGGGPGRSAPGAV